MQAKNRETLGQQHIVPDSKQTILANKNTTLGDLCIWWISLSDLDARLTVDGFVFVEIGLHFAIDFRDDFVQGVLDVLLFDLLAMDTGRSQLLNAERLGAVYFRCGGRCSGRGGRRLLSGRCSHHAVLRAVHRWRWLLFRDFKRFG